MKLFGKKTLALFLALAMVMPMCVFAEGEGAGGESQTPVAVTGVSLSKNSVTLAKGGTVDLTATVSPDNAADKTVTWSSGDTKIATVDASGKVTAVGGGTATITAAAGGVSDTCKVTVTGDDIKSVAAVALDVAYGTTAEKAAEALANKEVDVTYVSDGTGKEKISGWTAKGEYKATTPGNYTFENATYSATATVTVKKATMKSDVNVGSIAFPVGTDVEDIADELDEEFDELDLEFNELENDIEVSIGGAYGDYKAWKAPTSFDEDEVGTYTFTAAVNTDSDYYNYCQLQDLKLTVVIYTEDYELEVERGGKSLSALATQLDTILDALYGDGLDLFVITDLELDGGELYTDSTCDTELDEDELTKTELAAVYYLPNGSGEDSVIEFEAYYDEDDDEEILEGSLTLVADPYMMISIEVSEDDVITLDADEFEDQFLNQNDDYEELSYVTFTHTNGKSKGYLYYDYDEDEEKGSAVKGAKCFVDADDDDIDLDDVVYVPGADMKAGTYTITFTAKGYKEGSTSLKTETGYLVITFIEKADITIEAGKSEVVDVDADLFQDWLEDEVGGSKTLNIVSVSISGAPRSKTAGYLVTDDDQLTKSGAKVFYADPDEDEYDLDDIQFEGGSKNSTTNATFKITYTAGTSSTKKYKEGTIDFIVGASHTIGNNPESPLKAAQIVPFKDDLDDFETLGDNDNVYVEFTSLPRGGKLYYNYGLASQEDVTVGTDYYLTSASGKKQLRNVTFVPSYSSSKVQQTITFGVKGYDKNDKSVSGTVTIYVTYASYSAYFTDVKTSMYADSVDFLYNRGITTGMTTTTFGPDTNVTRGQFVTFLYRAAGQPAVTATNKFTDVKSSDYYYNAVRWAVQNGITNGRSATVFDPNANVTYQEIMTFLYRYDVSYLKHTNYSAGSTSFVYDYAKVDTWAQTAVKWAVGKGVLTSGNLNPTTAGTRANVALYMHRMLTL